MGYKDEFYIRPNIIGYTGTPQNNPTVYFDDGIHYGSITQHHEDPNAVGRTNLRLSAEHHLLNYTPNMEDGYVISFPGMERAREVGAMLELKSGQVTHISRNPFVPVKQADTQLMAILTMSIERFKNLKRTNFQRLVNLYNHQGSERFSFAQLHSELSLCGHTDFHSLEQEIRYICQIEGQPFPPS